MSLLAPNKNSFAQSLWYKKEKIAPQKFKLYENSNEIQTHRNSKESNFSKALDYAINWKDDEPYSLRPYSVASHLSGVLLGDNNRAYELIKGGMESQKLIKGDNYSTKDEIALNNDIAYYLLKANRVAEAEKFLKPALKILNKSSKLDNIEYVNLATLGLLAYKQKDDDFGRKLYRKTIKHFTEMRLHYLAGSAFLNFFDEEINVVSDISILESLKRELEALVPKTAEKELIFRKDKSLSLFKARVAKLK